MHNILQTKILTNQHISVSSPPRSDQSPELKSRRNFPIVGDGNILRQSFFDNVKPRQKVQTTSPRDYSLFKSIDSQDHEKIITYENINNNLYCKTPKINNSILHSSMDLQKHSKNDFGFRNTYHTSGYQPSS